ncbi:MAG: DnaB-like helicase C-terminal domain-containing protein [Planctomycetota bacterium]
MIGPRPLEAAALAADEIREAHGRRLAAGHLADALVVARDPTATAGDVAKVIERIDQARELIGANAGRTEHRGLVQILDNWARQDVEPVVPTLFGPLDRRLGGGLPIGLTAIAAKPGEGKSALALQLTLGALAADLEARAVWYRGEMTNELLAGKMLAIWGEIRGKAVAGCTFKDARRRTQRARTMAVDLAGVIGDRLQVVDPPLTPETIEAAILRHRPRLAVVDYLQLCQADQQADRRAEIEHITRQLADLAVRHEIAIIVVSSLAKTTGREAGIGAIAKDSNLLDYAAHTVLSLWTNGAKDADPRDVRLQVEKSRTAVPGEIQLYFSGSGQSFTLADPEEILATEGYDEFAAFTPEALA